MSRPVILAACAAVASSSDVIVRMKATTETPLASLDAADATRQGVHARLSEHATITQADIVGLLNEERASYQSFWIDNVVAVKGASDTLISKLKARDDVLAVDLDEHVFLPRLEKN